ncbi:MAG: hypothetical protein SGILL_007006 [Bacillariaceae sp.]
MSQSQQQHAAAASGPMNLLATAAEMLSGSLGKIGDARETVSPSLVGENYNEEEDTSQDAPSSTLAVEGLLANEMEKLSLNEREEIDDQIHGFSSLAAQESSPELIEDALIAMDNELKKLPSSKLTQAFQKGIDMNSAYLHDKAFRLKFLRAEKFHAQKAASRFCKWLNVLHVHFGDAALQRPLFMSDLGKEEMKLLRIGSAQFLGSRDRCGRRVAIFLDSMGGSDKFSLKVSVYLFSAISDDELTQQYGLVFVMKPNFDFKQMMDSDQQRQSEEFLDGMPLRYTAFHMWMFPEDTAESSALQAIIRGLVLLALGKERRMLTRIHTGPRTEIEYQLRNKYGIPTSEIPLTSSGKIKTNYLTTWINYQKSVDDYRKLNGNHQPSSLVGVECPDFRSIVFRRQYNAGSMILDINKHPPNKVFDNILASRVEEFTSIRPDYQIKIVESIIHEAHQMSFCFLTWNKNYGWYVELCNPNGDMDKAERPQLREFVNRAMKDHIKRTKARKNEQINTDSNKEGLFVAQYGKKQKKVCKRTN